MANEQQTIPIVRRSSRLHHHHTCMACNVMPDKNNKLRTFIIDNDKIMASWPPYFKALEPRYKKGCWVRICSLHFKPECFKDNDRKVLKRHSIPTVIHRSVSPVMRQQVKPAAIAPAIPSKPADEQSTIRSTSLELALLSKNGFKLNLTSCSMKYGEQWKPFVATGPREYPIERNKQTPQSSTFKRPLIDCRISRPLSSDLSTSRAYGTALSTLAGPSKGTSSDEAGPLTDPGNVARTSFASPWVGPPKVKPDLTVIVISSNSTSAQHINNTEGTTLELIYKFIKENCLTPSEALAAESGEIVFVLDKPMLRYKLDDGLNLFMCRLCMDAIYSYSNYVEHDCKKNDDMSKQHMGGVPIDYGSRESVATSLVEYIWDEPLPAGTKHIRWFSIIADDDNGMKPWD